MASSVQFPARAAAGLAFLKANKNDIDVFVEDTACRNMWNKIIQKHLPNGVKFDSVNILGGKNVVVSAFSKDIGDPKRPRIFIVDSDLDLFRTKIQRTKISKSGALLHKTYGYCIENHLIQEDALVDICGTAATEKSNDEIRRILDIPKFIRENSNLLSDLFAAFKTAQVLLPGERTISNSCRGFFINEKNWIRYCPKKIRRQILLYHKSIKNKTREECKILFNKYRGIANKRGSMRIASGKDYLLTPIHIIMQKNFGYKAEVDQLKVSIVKSEYYKPDSIIMRNLSKIVEESRQRRRRKSKIPHAS